MTRIAIVGAGSAGCLTALALSKSESNSIDCYFNDSIPPIGVGEATTNYVQSFLDRHGINKKTILNSINGSLKLGLLFENFFSQNHSFIHPFGDNKDISGEIEYMIMNDKIPNDILQYDTIATHFDTNVLSRYIVSKISKKSNVKIINKLFDIDQSCDYDVVVDCTGFRRHVFTKIIDDNYVDMSHVIPNNQALIYRSKYTNIDQHKPYTKCTGMSHGWIWNIPLGNRISHGYVHSDQYDVTQEFINYITKIHKSCNESEISKIPFKTGRNKIHITTHKSTLFVAIGLSSCFIEPLESTGLHFVVENIELLERFLAGDINQEQFNSIINTSYDSVVNFVVAHYKYTSRKGKYWRQYTNHQLSDYQHTDVFPVISWDYILRGMGQPHGDIIQQPNLSILKKHINNMSYQLWNKNEKDS